jgi:hypothetical protein
MAQKGGERRREVKKKWLRVNLMMEMKERGLFVRGVDTFLATCRVCAQRQAPKLKSSFIPELSPIQLHYQRPRWLDFWNLRECFSGLSDFALTP